MTVNSQQYFNGADLRWRDVMTQNVIRQVAVLIIQIFSLYLWPDEIILSVLLAISEIVIALHIRFFINAKIKLPQQLYQHDLLDLMSKLAASDASRLAETDF